MRDGADGEGMKGGVGVLQRHTVARPARAAADPASQGLTELPPIVSAYYNGLMPGGVPAQQEENGPID